MNIDRLYKRGLYLEYFTIAYNILEATVSIIFGSIASSIALIGFGLDSIVVAFLFREGWEGWTETSQEVEIDS